MSVSKIAIPDGKPSSSESPGLLVFSLAGRIGSGASFVGRSLRDELFAYKYDVTIVNVSLLIMLYTLNFEAAEEGDDSDERALREFEEKYPFPKQRTKALQDKGNELRSLHGNNILARIVVSGVVAEHLKKIDGGVRNRQAFIIDSLKRPEEIEFLKRVFGSSYFAVGVVSTDAKREERLKERKHYDRRAFEEISEIDRKERKIETGQRAVDTVLRSDYFFANDYSTKDELKPEIARFVGLIFNASMITPRSDEFAMNIAFKAAAKSACLSRQVGSAIIDSEGRLLATGCNDVPKFGGGLYTSEDEHDRRCWARGGKCYNDEEKSAIIREVVALVTGDGEIRNLLGDVFQDVLSGLEEETSLSRKALGSFADSRSKFEERLTRILATSRIRQLIEFSRAIHAEMNAIMSIARSGKSGLEGATLYCTTYPCHNCAKHIIDAGIKSLVYLEPYEKSLARQLHSDAINDSSEDGENRVIFRLYNGVSPSRYSDFFEKREDRKNKRGKYIDRSDARSSLLPSSEERADELWRRIEKEVTPQEE